jgi:hypothetical protein
MKKALSSIIILFILLSCNKSPSIPDLLTNGDIKYWDAVQIPNLYQKKDKSIFPAYCYYFDKSGNCKFLYYNKGGRVLYDTGDLVLPQNWKLLSDSTMSIQGHNAIIKRLDKDTLIYITNGGKYIFCRSAL